MDWVHAYVCVCVLKVFGTTNLRWFFSFFCIFGDTITCSSKKEIIFIYVNLLYICRSTNRLLRICSTFLSFIFISLLICCYTFTVFACTEHTGWCLPAYRMLVWVSTCVCVCVRVGNIHVWIWIVVDLVSSWVYFYLLSWTFVFLFYASILSWVFAYLFFYFVFFSRYPE